jgi:preprotein translocase subunit SecE
MSETDLPEDQGSSREPDHSVPPAPRARTSKSGGGGGPIQFARDVQLEMKRVSWPSRSEVATTTVICLIAVVFFGLYLWGVDSLLALFFHTIEGWLK